jgi:hypothetical protein
MNRILESGRRLHCPSATASAAKRFIDLVHVLYAQCYVGLWLLSLAPLACQSHVLSDLSVLSRSRPQRVATGLGDRVIMMEF